MKFSKNEKRLLVTMLIALAISATILLTSAFSPGSHGLYLSKPNATEFCGKCHAEKVSNIESSVHGNTGCLCHGYNPSATELNNLNLAHNLTKNIYCTNCHSSYDMTSGDIVIHPGVSGINQSAHYIINSSGDKTPLYDRAKQYIKDNPG